MKVERFDIWLADLNPRFGTEAGKTRPVLVVQSDLLNKVHPSTIICPITTNIKKGANILRVDIKKGEGGTQRDSSVMIDQIRAIDNKRFTKKIGRLPEYLQDKVVANVKVILEIA